MLVNLASSYLQTNHRASVVGLTRSVLVHPFKHLINSVGHCPGRIFRNKGIQNAYPPEAQPGWHVGVIIHIDENKGVLGTNLVHEVLDR
jgi:hypothetical protein